MDIPALAATVTRCLVPALPYLTKAGEKGAEIVGEKLGAGVWERAKALWQKLGPAVEANPPISVAVQDVVATPEDPDAQAALCLQLRKLLMANEHLAAALAQVLETAAPSGHYHAHVQGAGAVAQGPGAVAAGQGGVAAGRDIHGGVRIGGTDFIETALRRKS